MKLLIRCALFGYKKSGISIDFIINYKYSTMDIGCSLFGIPFTILKKDLFILKRSVFGPI